MSSPLEGKRKIQWQGEPPKTRDWRVDVPDFKPASPPKSNPWTNFAPRSVAAPSAKVSHTKDPPLPCQTGDDQEVRQVESCRGDEVARADTPERDQRDASMGCESKKSPPTSRPAWADEIAESDPEVALEGDNSNNNNNKGDTTSATTSTNPWFSSTKPWSTKTKTALKSPEPQTSDAPLPLPSISETESSTHQPAYAGSAKTWPKKAQKIPETSEPQTSDAPLPPIPEAESSTNQAMPESFIKPRPNNLKKAKAIPQTPVPQTSDLWLPPPLGTESSTNKPANKSPSRTWSEKAKAIPETPGPQVTDAPLPPNSETGSSTNQSANGTSFNNSKSTVLGSPLKHEISMADDKPETEQTHQALPPVPNESLSQEYAKVSRPPSRESVHSLTSADTARRTARSGSVSSEDSRRAPTAAMEPAVVGVMSSTPVVTDPNTAAMATATSEASASSVQSDEGLWLNPLGADIRVEARDWSCPAHRHIIEPQSRFFEEILPGKGAKRVTVRVECTPGALAHSMFFMYHHRLENISSEPPYDRWHLSRCVLMYSCGVMLRIKDMVFMILEVVEATAGHVAEALRQSHHSSMHHDDILNQLGVTEEFIVDALKLLYDEPCQELMKPMRMAMAAVLDTSFLWLLQSPGLHKRLDKLPWSALLGNLLRDIVECRLVKAGSITGSVLPDIGWLELLLERDELRIKTPNTIVVKTPSTMMKHPTVI